MAAADLVAPVDRAVDAVVVAVDPPVPGQTPTKDDWKPSSVNQPQQQYPQVNSEGFARFRVSAPNAQAVTVTAGLGGAGGTPLKKGENGMWEATTAGPLDEGFHYYHLTVDGGTFNDPGTLNFYGSIRWESGIEIPAHDRDFYALKDVPHGKVQQVLFPSKSTGTVRRAFVYTPPDYERTAASAIRCCTCSMAGARTKPPGATRAMPT